MKKVFRIGIPVLFGVLCVSVATPTVFAQQSGVPPLLQPNNPNQNSSTVPQPPAGKEWQCGTGVNPSAQAPWLGCPTGQACQIKANDPITSKSYGFCDTGSGSNQSQTGVQTPTTNGFVPLAPIPGLTDQQTVNGELKTGSFATFFNNIYKYLIGLAAILAVIEIVMGGAQLAAQKGNVESALNGKSRITRAVLGLVLVLAPVLVFSIINPAILNLDIGLSPLKSAASIPDTNSPTASIGTPTNITGCFNSAIPTPNQTNLVTCFAQTLSDATDLASQYAQKDCSKNDQMGFLFATGGSCDNGTCSVKTSCSPVVNVDTYEAYFAIPLAAEHAWSFLVPPLGQLVTFYEGHTTKYSLDLIYFNDGQPFADSCQSDGSGHWTLMHSSGELVKGTLALKIIDYIKKLEGNSSYLLPPYVWQGSTAGDVIGCPQSILTSENVNYVKGVVTKLQDNALISSLNVGCMSMPMYCKYTP